MNYKHIKKKSDNKNKSKETINRKCSKCEEENNNDDKKELIQINRKSSPINNQNLEISNEIKNDIENIIGSNGGEPLDITTKEFMESRFRYDFSNVRMHTSQKAVDSADAVNANAYTLGNKIVLNAGQYDPNSDKGKKILAHELTHVIQQENNNAKLLQRLIRTPYPWKGIIRNNPIFNLLDVLIKGDSISEYIGREKTIRSSPDQKNPNNIIGTFSLGQPVKVISNTSNWLKVEGQSGGSKLDGYIFHWYVDDTTSLSMERSVGTKMVWKPSHPGSGTDFEKWASAPHKTPFPTVTSNTVMNCWEAVLLSAYKSGSITWDWIHSLYTTPIDNQVDWMSKMSRGGLDIYSLSGPNLHMPQRGDLVFFDGLSHVALATGNKSEVYTFWPPPNTPFTLGGTTDKVKIFTIEALVSWWIHDIGETPFVTFGAPSW